ncbi:uncharacterized protein LOC111328403 [Paramuricea clavata]|uniref:Uncharacterized protein LOC111328403 n=1 Tax=Paramuricea clavata TaxID=317549 RepID=A0A6S7IZI4_PARCT|nr:uncharacterized protein LOC111328403 [Paramuricea clavata]
MADSSSKERLKCEYFINSGDREGVLESNSNEATRTDSQPVCGRPRKTIPRDYLEDLISLKVPVSEIARSLGVSHPTVYAAIQGYNIRYEGRFSSHSDENLQDAVIGIKRNHLNAGEVMVQGHLRAQGVNVQRSRLRSIIKEVDPEGVQARSRLPIR